MHVHTLIALFAATSMIACYGNVPPTATGDDSTSDVGSTADSTAPGDDDDAGPASDAGGAGGDLDGVSDAVATADDTGTGAAEEVVDDVVVAVPDAEDDGSAADIAAADAPVMDVDTTEADTASDATIEPGPSGHMLYESPISGGNTFACATCHSLEEPSADGIRRIGHPIGDAFARPTYKNGQLTELIDAVNSCRDEWMNLEPWEPDDADWHSLRDFLEDHAPDGEAPPITFSIVDPPLYPTGGDPDAGNATFNMTCAACHGTDGGGTMRGPPLAGVGYPEGFVTSKARTSGPADSPIYDLAGGIMPFWGGDRLSDTELKDIAAWLAGSEAPEPPPEEEDMTMPPADGGPPDDTPACTSDHPMVGWTTELSNLFHMVGGTATIVDDCTIEITDFTFDGNGIEVRIYGGTGGNFNAGPPLSDDLYNWPVGYDHVTLSFQLPADVTLDDFDGISVWCVAVGVSFGHGTFAP